MNVKYKFNKEWLDLMLKNKNNINATFNLSDNDTRILLTYIEVLKQENARLKEKNKKAIDKLEYYNSGEALWYVPIQEIIDILKGSGE